MWKRLAHFVLKYRLVLLLALLAVTGVMGYYASQVKLSYEFAKAIPVDNPKYKEYISFKKKFGDDGNLLVIGIRTDSFFSRPVFNSIVKLQEDLKKVPHVENVLGVSSAANLVKNDSTEKLEPIAIFPKDSITQEKLDSAKKLLYKLPFYKTLLYNPDSNAYVIGTRINKEVLNSVGRWAVVSSIINITDSFTTATHIQTHLSGLPLIRTLVAHRIEAEMKWFLLGSLFLSAVILILFFRSFKTMLLSLGVVIVSVIWSFGILQLFGYKISLLTALIPPLIVVIGIPNCIYFLNKYHSTYIKTHDKKASLIDMVSKMGVVTLFCNISAAIGFAVFALTKSAVLKEFGQVAGTSIMLIFVISFILLPAVLSYMKPPTPRQTKYLDSRLLTAFLIRIELWVVHHKKVVYGATAIILIFSIFGILKLKTEGFIVDDLPRSDKIYTDLKFFEKNFKGVMPLEIVIEPKDSTYGILKKLNNDSLFEKMDALSKYIAAQPEMSRPLSIPEALKFFRQAYFSGDTNNYLLPHVSSAQFKSTFSKLQKDTMGKGGVSAILKGFIDTSYQNIRMSVNMADVGTKRLPEILSGIEHESNRLFDSTKYNIHLTGTSITFLEGSRFIINGLKESILWAFLLIALCMLYLFRSFRILVCSIIPNVIPLVITAGIMGWAGVRLKPSTVLIFSVALGIAIDVTIRFLVNYKQELPGHNNNVLTTVKETIRHTGLSILYTSIVLIAGFVIFLFSGFGGTQALGWLTSLTLFVATLTNLILLPVLLLGMGRKEKQFPDAMLN